MPTTAEATALQEDEVLALEAIYGDAVTVFKEEHRVQVRVPSPHGGGQQVVLQALLPPGYPLEGAPIVEVTGRHVPEDVLAAAARDLGALFVPGDVALYNWVERLKELDELWSGPGGRGGGSGGRTGTRDEDDDENGEREAHKPASQRQAAAQAHHALPAAREQEVLALLRSLGVTSGQPCMEKKSTFQAHVAPVSSFEAVQAVIDALLCLHKVRTATHNIMAYRIVPPAGAPGPVHQDYDDDGESAAGGRLLHLLQLADVRNVVVVVSRWFGGVLMGPSRFTAINNTARELLEQLGHMPRKGAGGAAGAGGGGGAAGGGHKKGGGRG